MTEAQNTETTVKWAKCFLCQKDTAETLFHLRNYVQFSRTWQVLQQLMKFHLIFYGLNRSRKKTLNQPSEITTLNIVVVAQQTMSPICLHERNTSAGKFYRMKKITIH